MKYRAGRGDEILARLTKILIPRPASQLSALSWLVFAPGATSSAQIFRLELGRCPPYHEAASPMLL